MIDDCIFCFSKQFCFLYIFVVCTGGVATGKTEVFVDSIPSYYKHEGSDFTKIYTVLLISQMFLQINIKSCILLLHTMPMTWSVLKTKLLIRCPL